MNSVSISPSENEFHECETLQQPARGNVATRQPALAGLRILVVVANEQRLKDLCARCVHEQHRTGSLQWQDNYDAARAALVRGDIDLAILDSRHHGLALLRDIATICPNTPAVLLGCHESERRYASARRCAYLARGSVNLDRLSRALETLAARTTATRVMMRSQNWWRSGGRTASQAIDLPAQPESHGNFFFNAAPNDQRDHPLVSVMRHLPVMIGRLDATGAIREVDGAMLARHGLEARGLLGMHFLTLFPEGRDAVARAFAGAVARFETRLKSGTADEAHMVFDLYPDSDHRGEVGFFGQETAAPQNFGDELLSAVDSERHRIGADLHDEVGQLLTGITCLSAVLIERLRGRDDLAAEDAAVIAGTAKEALAQIRSLAHGLAPVQMSRQGLSAALEELRTLVQRMHHVEVRLSLPRDPCDIDAETMTHAFRIVQEAVANAIRHGRATAIDVSLRRISDRYCLAITDNGCGFDPTTPPESAGAGLRLMEYRAAQIQGRLTVSSSPAHGTRIEVSLKTTHAPTHENAS